MLIRAGNKLINTDHIVSVTAGPETLDHPCCTIAFAGGSTVPVQCSIRVFENACGPVVPAQPGFMLIKALFPDMEGEEIIYSEEPIIAFRVPGSGDAVPITVSGETNELREGEAWCVRQPNGLCFGPSITNDDEATFRRLCEQQAADDLAEAARNRAAARQPAA